MFWPPLGQSVTHDTTSVTTASEERSNIKETKTFQICKVNVNNPNFFAQEISSNDDQLFDFFYLYFFSAMTMHPST